MGFPMGVFAGAATNAFNLQKDRKRQEAADAWLKEMQAKQLAIQEANAEMTRRQAEQNMAFQQANQDRIAAAEAERQALLQQKRDMAGRLKSGLLTNIEPMPEGGVFSLGPTGELLSNPDLFTEEQILNAVNAFGTKPDPYEREKRDLEMQILRNRANKPVTPAGRGGAPGTKPVLPAPNSMNMVGLSSFIRQKITEGMTQAELQKYIDEYNRQSKDPKKSNYDVNYTYDQWVAQANKKKDPASKKPATPAKGKGKVVKTGTYKGRKVVQYEDGSVEYAD
jgi:hypothetical protein